MKQTWRWFGPDDPVTLAHVRQAGAVGVVSALHHMNRGQAWTDHEVLKRKAQIESAGLSWDVVESIAVPEAIKTRTGDARAKIDKAVDIAVNLCHLLRHLRHDGAVSCPIAAQRPQVRLKGIEPRLHIIANRNEQGGAQPVQLTQRCCLPRFTVEPRAFQGQGRLVQQAFQQLDLVLQDG